MAPLGLPASCAAATAVRGLILVDRHCRFYRNADLAVLGLACTVQTRTNLKLLAVAANECGWWSCE